MNELPTPKRRPARQRVVHADKLTGATVGRGRDSDPWRLVLQLDETSGVAAVADRPTVAVLTMAEMARVVGAIPALLLTNPGADGEFPDLRAVHRVVGLLERLAEQEGAEQ